MVSSFLRNVFGKTMKKTVQSFLSSSEIMTENNAKQWKPNEVNPSLGNFRPQLSETSGRSVYVNSCRKYEP